MIGNARAIAGVPFHPGDVVRLTKRCAKTCTKRANRFKIDWKHRRGVIQRCDRNTAVILWDGRTTVDSFPVRALESITCVSSSLPATANMSVAPQASSTR